MRGERVGEKEKGRRKRTAWEIERKRAKKSVKRVNVAERQLKVFQIRVGNDKLIKLYISPALQFVIVAYYVYVIFNMTATWLPICRECKLGLIS